MKSHKKSAWIINKERHRKKISDTSIWLFGLHAVRAALENPIRKKLHLMITKNAYDKLGDLISETDFTVEVFDTRKFTPPIDPQSIHQGIALEVKPLEWDSISTICAPQEQAPRVIVLDRVSDPHNVGAILRSAEVFGACAVIATARHAAPETGALAKTASGALERQPYLRVGNLAQTLETLRKMGYYIIGMDATATTSIEKACATYKGHPLAIVMGSEGAGLRDLTKTTCDELVKINFLDHSGSLNVSNAAAVALYASTHFHR